MNCFYHPDRDAMNTCSKCRQAICSECNYVTGTQPICRNCWEKASATHEVDVSSKLTASSKPAQSAKSEKREGVSKWDELTTRQKATSIGCFTAIVIGVLIGVMLAITPDSEVPTSSILESEIIKVDSNLAAAKVKAGMIYGEDFIIAEDYQIAFMKTRNCSDVHFEGDILHYQLSDDIHYTPYFMWVCYPQITKTSRATVIVIEDIGGSLQKSGIWIVISVFRKDTGECLQEFGGTSGTHQAGW